MRNALKRPAGAGWQWIRQAFSLWSQQPLSWIVMMLIYMTLAVACSLLLPLVGDVLFSLFSPVFIGGMMLAAARNAADERFGIGALFDGFRGERFGRLLMLGALQFFATLLLVFLVGVLAAVLIGAQAVGADFSDPAAFEMLDLRMLGLVGLVTLGLMVPLVMAFWFAPAAVVLGNCSAMDAIEYSFQACIRNIVPFLVYGIIALLLLMVAAVPAGLGLLVMMPVIVITAFTGFADIFGPPEDTTTQPPQIGPDDGPTPHGGSGP